MGLRLPFMNISTTRLQGRWYNIAALATLYDTLLCRDSSKFCFDKVKTMSLLDAITSAIANPEQLGDAGQVGTILNTVGAIVSSQGTSANSADLMSAVGSVVRSSLQSQQANMGTEGVESIVNQFAGGSPNAAAVQAIFGGREQQVVEAIAQRTGMDANQINAILPTVLPLVLQLLQSGVSNSAGGNSVLSTFLDSDNDGDVDLGDVMAQAGRFLG
jgi:hypothetical protein